MPRWWKAGVTRPEENNRNKLRFISVDDGQLGEIGRGVIKHAEDQQRTIIVGSESAAAVFIGGLEDQIADFAGGMLRRNGLQKSSKALRTELLQPEVFGYE